MINTLQKTIEKKSKQYIPEHMTYEIRKSPLSESIYLVIFYNDISRLIRFSDHFTGKYKTVLITQNTKPSKIINTIKKAVRTLEKQSLNRAFNKAM